jgi:glucosamine 6-phosphate synthetase-like amidotransferase/phosphosugar isomerase protein
LVLNDKELWKKYEDDITPKGKCDSEIIIALINHFVETVPDITTEEAIDFALQEVDAWYAMAIINARDPHKIYLVKDDHNPLHFGWWDTPEAAVFASEWSYVQDAHRKSITHSTSFPIVKCEFPNKQVITLDSVARGVDWKDYYIGRYTLKNAKTNQQELIDENEEEFQTTQGNRQ